MAHAWASVGTPFTGQGLATSWGTTVKTVTDLAGWDRPCCHINRAAGAAGPVGSNAGTLAAAVVAPLDHVVHDNDAMFSGGAVHIRTPGLWLVTLTAEWVNNGNGGWRSVAVWESSGSRWVATETKVGLVGVSTYHSLYALERLDTTDILQPKVAQSSGAITYCAGNDYGLAISCVLMGG